MLDRSFSMDSNVDDYEQDDFVSIDEWKPSEKKNVVIPSSWRKKQIGDYFNQQPGLDEIKKIKRFLRQKKPDAEIMNAFGITCDVLSAIKTDRYSPVEGISLDNLSKIYKEHVRIEERINKLQRGLNYIAKVLFIDKISMGEYKKACKKPISKIIKNDNEDEDENEYEF